MTSNILHHMGIFHSIGHMVLYIRRMFSMLLIFIVVFGGFSFTLTRLFIMMSEMESTGGCISQLSHIAAGVYSTFLIFHNKLDIRGLSIGVQTGFETSALFSFSAYSCIICWLRCFQTKWIWCLKTEKLLCLSINCGKLADQIYRPENTHTSKCLHSYEKSVD